MIVERSQSRGSQPRGFRAVWTLVKTTGSDFMDDNALRLAAAASAMRARVGGQFAPFYRVQGSFATDANTTVTMLPTNAYPAIYDFKPKQ